MTGNDAQANFIVILNHNYPHMKKFLLLIPILFLFIGCEKDMATNSKEDRVLTCGSTLEPPFQCISGAGKSTITTYDIPELIGCWDSDDFDFCIQYIKGGTGVITYKPSAFVKGSTQKIKWGAMVNSKGELILSNAGTVYIAHESLQGSLDPQIAMLSFKRSTKQWAGFDLVAIGECKAPTSGGGTTVGGKGNIVFWTKSDQGCGTIKVTINGQSNNITQYFANGSPACGQAGAASFELPAGQYTFSAECSKYKWNPTPFTITAGECLKMELK